MDEYETMRMQKERILGAKRAVVGDLVAALRSLSPYNLEDCWCPDADHGGGKPHTARCMMVRAALAKAVPHV